MSAETLEQKRARHALSCVEAVRREGFAARYRSYAESLPAQIVMFGLGQAVATELAASRGGEKEEQRNDGNRAHARLAADLESWLKQTVFQDRDPKKPPPGGLIGAIVSNDQAQYLRAQAEALAWLTWLKKLCQASLPRGAED